MSYEITHRWRVYKDRQGYWLVMWYRHDHETCWGFYSAAEGAWEALREIGW